MPFFRVDIEISFYSHANKTHFQKKGFASRNSEMAYSSFSVEKEKKILAIIIIIIYYFLTTFYYHYHYYDYHVHSL